MIHTCCVWNMQKGVVHKIRKMPLCAAMQLSAAATCIKCTSCERALSNCVEVGTTVKYDFSGKLYIINYFLAKVWKFQCGKWRQRGGHKKISVFRQQWLCPDLGRLFMKECTLILKRRPTLCCCSRLCSWFLCKTTYSCSTYYSCITAYSCSTARLESLQSWRTWEGGR